MTRRVVYACAVCAKLHWREDYMLTTRWLQVIGSIDGSGRVKLVDRDAPDGTPPAVDLDLEKVDGGGQGSVAARAGLGWMDWVAS
jgi:hypothetical protein